MLIGIDVGTTSVKAGLFDDDGHCLRSFGETYPTVRPQPGHVEQNPEDWMRLVRRALATLSESAAGTIAAIGLCSQVNTHVFVDAQLRALVPAITWQDGRCADVAAALDAEVSGADKMKWWGAPLPIDASHVLARMSHVQQTAPDVWANTRWVLAPKDYCIAHLTGEIATDPMTAFGIVDSTLSPITWLIDRVEGAASRLPPLSPFTRIVGRIRQGESCAGVPIVTSAMDAWSGTFGAGVAAERQAVYLSGTSEVIGIVSERKSPVPGVIAFPKCEGITLHAGPTQSGGSSVAWLARLLGVTPEAISSLAAKADTTQPLPLFLPHLDGERAPIWDVAARGGFANLNSAMAAPELSRAVLEGVAYGARWLLETLEASACISPTVLHHSGGGSASDLWCQIRADALGKPLRRTASRDAGVLGAALMASVAAGHHATLADAAPRFVQFDHEFAPMPSPRHDERFAQYKLMYEQMKALRI